MSSADGAVERSWWELRVSGCSVNRDGGTSSLRCYGRSRPRSRRSMHWPRYNVITLWLWQLLKVEQRVDCQGGGDPSAGRSQGSRRHIPLSPTSDSVRGGSCSRRKQLQPRQTSAGSPKTFGPSDSGMICLTRCFHVWQSEVRFFNCSRSRSRENVSL